MRLYKKQYINAIDNVLCDVCNASTKLYDQVGADYATIEACWGYGSKLDGSKYDIQLCENCFILLIDYLRGRRIVLGLNPSHNPAFEGTEYL